MLSLTRTSPDSGTPRQATRRLAAVWPLVVSLACGSAAAEGLTVVVACPDEFPGPPDCFDCQYFGNAPALGEGLFDYESREAFWLGPFGYFGPPEDGIDLYSNHFNCDSTWQDVGVLIGLEVFIAETGDRKASGTSVNCTGGGWVHNAADQSVTDATS